MNVLVINCGSSSLKYQLIDSESENVLAKGLCERIGIEGSRIVYKPTGKENQTIESPMPTHTEAIRLVLDCLTNKEYGVVASLEEVGAVGHRVVHGGETFSKATLITPEVHEAIKGTVDLAPLHVPANLIGIEVCQELMPGVPMVAVFDTAFHQTMPEKAFLYGVPYSYYEDYKIRRYGFHGTSHSYVSKKVAEVLGTPKEELKTIVCHLGNGASLCAVKNGESVDTSMGFTPITGLVMGTRCGDIDPEIVKFIVEKEGCTVQEVLNTLNKKSGVAGLSGGFVDFRDLAAGAEAGDEKCKRAIEVFCYNVATRIGAYAAAMNGVDAIAFTAGIGENDPSIRANVCEYLGYLGVKLDEAANNASVDDTVLTTADSKVKVLKIATNEELMIARETVEVVNA